MTSCSGSEGEENEDGNEKMVSGDDSSDDGSGSDSSDMDVEVCVRWWWIDDRQTDVDGWIGSTNNEGLERISKKTWITE